MTKFPIIEKLCMVCGTIVYGKDVTECPDCGCSHLIEEAT